MRLLTRIHARIRRAFTRGLTSALLVDYAHTKAEIHTHSHTRSPSDLAALEREAAARAQVQR